MEVKIIGYFDGSLKDKTGIGAWYLEIMADNEIIETDSGYAYEYKTNHRPTRFEFLALVELIKGIKKHNTYPDLKEIVVRGDCKGVFDCLNSKKEKPHKDFKESVRSDIADFNVPLRMEWIPRKYNKRTDKLCRDVYKAIAIV